MIDYTGKLRLTGGTDEIFTGTRYPKPFVFNEEVAVVFDDMVHRSVPLYDAVTEYAAAWAHHYYQPGTAVYDLGCSTGTTLEMIGRHLKPGAKLIGIDTSRAMLTQARQKLSDLMGSHTIQLIEGDASQCPFEPASFVVLNYTLQFMPIKSRRQLLKTIAGAMTSDGILFISEKVRSPYPEFQETTTSIYEAFKQRQGYSQREIERKKEALENVLIPLTEEELKDMISASGFQHVESVLKWNNFLTVVATIGDSRPS